MHVVNLMKDSPMAFVLGPKREYVKEGLLPLVKDFHSVAHFLLNLRIIDLVKFLYDSLKGI